jgi:serine protease Do
MCDCPKEPQAARHRSRMHTLAMMVGLLSLCVFSSRADACETATGDGYANLVARVLPSVVNISVRRAVPVQGSSETRDSGKIILGSGFIIDPQGYIVTNRHVVIDAYSITVGLSDGNRLVAQVVGHPPATDVALLKVTPEHPLAAVQFGDSDKVQVGERVFAIGNPEGFSGTVTFGFVSALNRDTADTPYDNYIQTDAAINHGNSGGPLFNTCGEVIGVNTELYSPTSGSIGLGFALPSDDVEFAVTELRRFGRVRPGWIGARLQEITPDLAQAFSAATTHGALVAAVAKSSPAEVAGLRPGDVILEFDNRTLTDVRALMRMIAESPLDSTTTLAVDRRGDNIAIPITIREYPPAMMIENYPFELSKPPTDSGDLGLRLAPLGPVGRGNVQLPTDAAGVEVTAVPPGSAADRAGLQPGDVILQVEGNATVAPADVEKDLREAQTQGHLEVGLLIVNSSGQRWVALPTKAAQVP